MMEAFTAYIKTIAAFTLFAAFAEMLMPDNSFKKYIQLIMGIMLLSVMLKPLFTAFSITDLDFEAFPYEQGDWSDALPKDREYYEALENKRIQEAYDLALKEKQTEETE